MQLINNLPIGRKIFTIVIILGLTQIIISTFAIFKMNDIASEFNVLNDIAMPLEKLVATTSKLQLQKEARLERIQRAAKSGARRKIIKEHIQALTDITALNELALKDSLAILDTAEAQPLQDDLRQDIMTLKEYTGQVMLKQSDYQAYVDGVVKVIKRGGSMAGGGYLSDEEQAKLEQIGASLFADLETMQVSLDHITQRTVENAKNVQNASLFSLIAISIASLLIGVLISQIIIKAIVSPIKEVMNTLNSMAQNNDLTKRMNFISEDEVGAMGKTFNNFVEKLQGLVSGIADSSEQLSTTAEETSVVSVSTNNNIAQQKNDTIQVASAITQMTATVQGSSHQCRKGLFRSITGR